MIACYHFIKLGDFIDVLNLAGNYLSEKHDLMHKAYGWMLREVGKRDFEAEDFFIDSIK